MLTSSNDPSNQLVEAKLPILDLPDETLVQILSHLGVITLLQIIPLVNKKVRTLCLDNQLWKIKLKQHFPEVYEELKDEININWFTQFKKTYCSYYENSPFPYVNKVIALLKDFSLDDLKNERSELAVELNKSDAITKMREQRNGMVKDKRDSSAKTFPSALQLAQQKNCQILLDRFYQAILLDGFYEATGVIADGKKLLSRALPSFFTAGYSPDVIKSDESGRTLLHWAILCGQPIDRITDLLDKGADLNAQIQCKRPDNGEILFYDTPLHLACKNDRSDIAKILIERGALVEVSDLVGVRAIHIACENGQREIVQSLLDRNPNLCQMFDFLRRTPLHYAASAGQVAIVEALLDHPLTVNIDQMNQRSIPNTFGETPLMEACKNGHAEVAEMLINRGANMEILDSLGRTPLYAACGGGLISTATLILEKKPAWIRQLDEIDAGAGATPLFQPARRGFKAMVEFLFAKGATMAKINEYGLHIIHAACQSGSLALVEFLLKKQPDLINRINEKNSKTPLDYAIGSGSVTLVEYLIQRGATVNYLSTDGLGERNTPLHRVCIHDQYHDKKNRINRRMMRVLLNANADTKALDGNNKTPKQLITSDKTKFEYKLFRYAKKAGLAESNQQQSPDPRSIFSGAATLFSHKSDKSEHSASTKPEYSEEANKAAAKALVQVIAEGANPACLEDHKDAFSRGKLAVIYENLRTLNNNFNY